MAPGPDEMPRFSDAQLIQLRQDFDEFKQEQRQQVDAIASALQQQAAALSELAASTAGVVQLYGDMQAAARLGTGVQAFVVWCLKWGGALGALGVGLKWIADHFAPPNL